jgi:multicomponent Na+:H+ antiporter subunit G
MSVLDTAAAVLFVLGTLFTVLAGIGLVRLPDAYARLSGTSKAAPFGIGLVLAGAALKASDASFATVAAAAALFLALTTPLAAHALARAMYRGRQDEDGPGE